ncbi:MAG: ECF-type sigma factor [Pirellulaceae bacterium]
MNERNCPFEFMVGHYCRVTQFSVLQWAVTSRLRKNDLGFSFFLFENQSFPMSDLQAIIDRINASEATIDEELLPIVYDQLRALASRQRAKEGVDSLQTTELVHEAYLRLVGSDQNWEGRAHFFNAAAEAMRRVLVDRARRRKSQKRGGAHQRVSMRDSAMEAKESPVEILEVNDLFDRLAEMHPQQAAVAKLRYFAGLSLAETANALGISVGTAHKYWDFSKAWLYRELQKP